MSRADLLLERAVELRTSAFRTDVVPQLAKGDRREEDEPDGEHHEDDVLALLGIGNEKIALSARRLARAKAAIDAGVDKLKRDLHL